MAETDVIGHLLEIEHQAAELLHDAQIEADRRIANAKNNADLEYKELYNNLISDFENNYTTIITKINQQHEKTMNDFISNLNNFSTDVVSFEKFLDSLLFTE